MVQAAKELGAENLTHVAQEMKKVIEFETEIAKVRNTSTMV